MPITIDYVYKKRWVANVLLAIASFMTYSAMYLIRKPISAMQFSDISLLGISLKVLLIISQILGYTTAKFIGVTWVSSIDKSKRIFSLLTLLTIGIFSLLAFALLPIQFSPLVLFVNGLSLGLIWGIVFSFIEGRHATDSIGLFLSMSFIFTSGLAKSLGVYSHTILHVSELWTPFLVGLVGIPVILIGSYILSFIPPPSKEEILARNDRTPMSSEERVKMFKGLKVSIIPLTLVYVILTIYRDLRDSFMVDIFHELLIDVQPSVFTSIEFAITFCVGLILLIIARIQSHRKALITHHILFLISALIIGITTFQLMNKQISAITCMFLTGFATYLAYVPFNSMLFERLISLYKYQGTVGFLIYFADSFGYLGSCILYIVSSLLMAKSIWLQTFLQTGIIYACISPILIAISLYFIMYIKPKLS
jgi:hypothetical protein